MVWSVFEVRRSLLFVKDCPTPIEVIDMWPAYDNCCVCDEEVVMEFGLPMYESEIVPSDWPGEWGGFTVCKRCYTLFNGIREPLPIAEAKRVSKRI
jgi:hypothetical protein